PAREAHAGLIVDVEQQREVGPERAGRPVVERAKPVEIEQASEALECERRIDVAVTEHRAPRLERGTDHLDDVLVPRCGEQQYLRERIELRGRIEQYGTDAIGGRRAARLLRHQWVVQQRLNATKLRRLAGAVDAFEGDEHINAERSEASSARVGDDRSF